MPSALIFAISDQLMFSPPARRAGAVEIRPAQTMGRVPIQRRLFIVLSKGAGGGPYLSEYVRGGRCVYAARRFRSNLCQALSPRTASNEYHG